MQMEIYTKENTKKTKNGQGKYISANVNVYECQYKYD